MGKIVVSLIVVASLAVAPAALAQGPEPEPVDVDIPATCLGTGLTAIVCAGGEAGTEETTAGDCVYVGSPSCTWVGSDDVPIPYVHVGCNGWIPLVEGRFMCPGAIYSTWP